MKRTYLLLVCIFLAWLSLLSPAFARNTRCNRYWIDGMEKEHARGLAILGPATTTDFQHMSVYVTIYHSGNKKWFYVQSNYKEHPSDFPIKIASSENVDLNRALSWIPMAGKNVNVNARGLTFYVDPAFFQDSTYGKYKGQMTGRIIRLKGTEEDIVGKAATYEYYMALGKPAASLKKYAEALKNFDKAIQADPAQTDAYLNRGHCYVTLKRDDRALEDFNLALFLKPDDSEALYQRGFLQLRQKRQQQAFLDFNRLIQVKPNFAPAYLVRAGIYDDWKRHDKALADFDQAIHLNPMDPNAFFFRGLSHLRVRDYGKAQDDFQTTLQLKPDYPNAKKILDGLRRLQR